MAVTIKDIAQLAGVSTATVSHIVNKTRYVSPELVERVEQIIKQTGYLRKNIGTASVPIGKQSVIAFVVPEIDTALCTLFSDTLNSYFSEQGYTFAVYISNADAIRERGILTGLCSDKRIAGIVLIPTQHSEENYRKLIKSGLPFVCLEKKIDNPQIFSVISESEHAGTTAALHLINSGHTDIALLVDNENGSAERIAGYRAALLQNGISFDERLVISPDNSGVIPFEAIIHKLYENYRPTAFIAADNRLTMMLMQALRNIGLNCPDDVSVVGFGDAQWCQLTTPPLTLLYHDAAAMARRAAQELCGIIREQPQSNTAVFEPRLIVRSSTRMIGRGPFGENAISPDKIRFSDEEKRQLRQGRFKVAISFHYGGTAWARLHEAGIRNTLEAHGVRLMSVTDAQLDPALQITQLDAVAMQKPDLVIAIPADDKATAQRFKQLAKQTKLVFISNVPEGLHKGDYAGCVSVNERENGATLGRMLGDYYVGKEHIKVGLIQHGTPFYGTHLRDMVAQQTLIEQYDNIEIADIKRFEKISDAYSACKRMLERNGSITAIYVSWDRPALEVIRALKELGREDVRVFTFDLDFQIAKYLASGKTVAGICSQRPYEQGEAVALTAMKALVSNENYKYVGVAPYPVTRKGLLRAWKEIMHESAPMEIERALENITL